MLPPISHSSNFSVSKQECSFCGKLNNVDNTKRIYYCNYCRRTNYAFEKVNLPPKVKNPSYIEVPNLEVSYLCMSCNFKNKNFNVNQPPACNRCGSQLLVKDGYRVSAQTPRARPPVEEAHYSDIFPADIFKFGYHPFYVYDNGYINKYLHQYNQLEHSIEQAKEAELKKFRNRREMERIKREMYAMYLKKDIYKPMFDTVHSINYKYLHKANRNRNYM